MSIHDTIKDIEQDEEDELFIKAVEVFEKIEFKDHEKALWERQGKYITWEGMLFKFTSGSFPTREKRLIRCFICPKCNMERTIYAVFDDRAGLINAAMQDEDCFYCNNDTFESMIRDIVQEALDDR